MKKENQFRDTRFDVNTDTEILNGIKKNNKTMDLLDQLEALTDQLYTSWRVDGGGENLIYKDKEGESIEPGDFWDNILNWLDINQAYLLKDSQIMYKKLLKKKVA